MTPTDTDVTADLVRDLVREQFPEYGDLAVRFGARGWDNQMWRLGDDLVVRLPWATDAAEGLLRKEYAWVPTFADRLPWPVPVPQRLGVPSERFAQHWLITTWVPGTPADQAPATRDSGESLAAFLTALHQPAPEGAPVSRTRGGPFAPTIMNGLTTAVERGLIRDPDAARAVLQDAVDAPAWTGPAVWLHADLHPANVVTADGRLTGVIDFGDLCVGDPAYDLSAAWLLLPDGATEDFQAAYGPGMDAATRRRARGWAMARAIGGILIAEQGPPGGKPSWGPPGHAAMERLLRP